MVVAALHSPIPVKVRPFVPTVPPLVRAVFRVAGRLAPALLAPVLERFFFTPLRFPAPPRENEWLEQAELLHVHSAVGRIQVYRWLPAPSSVTEGRSPPTVLLVHGWAGRASQMGAIAVALANAGCEVLAFDGPGHGRNRSRQTNALEFAAALHSVVETLGRPDVVITHSMGAFVAGAAMAGGLPIPKIAFIAPPPSLEEMTSIFAKIADIPPRALVHLRRRIENRIGADIWRRFSTGHHARLWQQQQSEVLVIHDEDDEEATIVTAEELVRNLPGAHLMRTQGLGHRRIVRDDAVLRALVGFARPG